MVTQQVAPISNEFTVIGQEGGAPIERLQALITDALDNYERVYELFGVCAPALQFIEGRHAQALDEAYQKIEQLSRGKATARALDELDEAWRDREFDAQVAGFMCGLLFQHNPVSLSSDVS